MKTFHLFRVVASGAILVAGWCHVAALGQVSGTAGAGVAASASRDLQHPNASAAVNTNGAAAANGTSVNTNGAASGGMSVPVTQMQAELATKVDSKMAKAGDAVEARTTKTVTMADGTVIPKGSKLMGTVTQVQVQEKGQAESTLGLSFDRVRLRGGQEVMVRSSIDNVSNPVGVNADSDMAMDDMIGAGPIGAGSAVGGRGGLGAGGLVGGVSGGANSAAGRSGSALASTAQATAQGTSGLARGTAQGAGGTASGSNALVSSGLLSGAAQPSVGVAGHATNVPGVMLSGSATEGASGVFSAAGKNVHLESGTQMVLSVAAQR